MLTIPNAFKFIESVFFCAAYRRLKTEEVFYWITDWQNAAFLWMNMFFLHHRINAWASGKELHKINTFKSFVDIYKLSESVLLTEEWFRDILWIHSSLWVTIWIGLSMNWYFLTPINSNWFSLNDGSYQRDHSKSYTSESVHKWLEKHNEEFTVLSWFRNS